MTDNKGTSYGCGPGYRTRRGSFFLLLLLAFFVYLFSRATLRCRLVWNLLSDWLNELISAIFIVCTCCDMLTCVD